MTTPSQVLRRQSLKALTFSTSKLFARDAVQGCRCARSGRDYLKLKLLPTDIPPSEPEEREGQIKNCEPHDFLIGRHICHQL